MLKGGVNLALFVEAEELYYSTKVFLLGFAYTSAALFNCKYTYIV